jgi:hypothetical protein
VALILATHCRSRIAHSLSILSLQCAVGQPIAVQLNTNFVSFPSRSVQFSSLVNLSRWILQ